MRIAVCDDDKKDASVIREYFSRFDAGLSCDVFHSALNLLNTHCRESYDLIFLDIEMKPLNGFEAARVLTADKEKPLIIFVTNSSKYTILGYEVAFRYLIKPITYEQLGAVMKASMEQIVPKKIMIEIQGKSMMISTRDIYYFEVFDHNVRVRTDKSIYDYRDSLKNLEELLSGGSFVRPHKSYLVNLEYVVSTS